MQRRRDSPILISAATISPPTISSAPLRERSYWYTMKVGWVRMTAWLVNTRMGAPCVPGPRRRWRLSGGAVSSAAGRV